MFVNRISKYTEVKSLHLATKSMKISEATVVKYSQAHVHTHTHTHTHTLKIIRLIYPLVS